MLHTVYIIKSNFYHPWKSFASAGFEPMNLVLSGKHANHYITESTTPLLH
jgi:hypothetical protein